VAWIALAAVYLTVTGLLLNGSVAIMFTIYGTVLALTRNPWTARRRRTNAETALAANS
jgi:hypothetical protein